MEDGLLIVGLGNPGSQYQYTRHNVGAELVARLAETYRITLNADRSYKGRIGRGGIEGVDVRLLLPETYMNLSGQSVGAVAHFYKLPVDSILVAYDELAFEPGQIKLKTGGGHNGHNGVASVIDGLGNDRSFHRLRIGVGHPGHKDLVLGWVLRDFAPEERDPKDGWLPRVLEALAEESALLAEGTGKTDERYMSRVAHLASPPTPNSQPPDQGPKA